LDQGSLSKANNGFGGHDILGRYCDARSLPFRRCISLVLLIITDDAGYGVPSTFGGVIPTPALDRIANNGLGYINFHSTALCSPTRGALIVGRYRRRCGAEGRDEIDAATRPTGSDAYPTWRRRWSDWNS
jgi:Sulfatase